MDSSSGSGSVPRVRRRAAMNTVPSSPTSSQRGCLIPDASVVREPLGSRLVTRPAHSSATSTRPSRSKARPIGRSSPRSTMVADRSGATRVTVPAARSLTYTLSSASTATPRGWRSPRAQTLIGASATGDAAARLGTWVAPGEDSRKIRPMTAASREIRGLWLMSALAMWDMREQGAAAMPLGSPSATPTESKIRAHYLGQKLEAAQSRGQSARTALRLAELVRDEIRRQEDQIMERAGPEQARVGLADAHGTASKDAIDLRELLDRRLAIRPHQRIGQLHEHAMRLGVVDVGIDAVEIAQRALQPKPARLEHEPLVLQVAAPRSPDSQAQLEGHIEARHPASHVHAAQIVEGIVAGGDQLDDPVEPGIGAGQLQRRARSEAESTEPGDESQEQLLVARVVGNVQEGVVARVAFGDVAATALARGRARRRRAGSLCGDGVAARRLRLSDTGRLAVGLATLAEQKCKKRRELPHPRFGDAERLGGGVARRIGRVDPDLLHSFTLRRSRTPCQFTAGARSSLAVASVGFNGARFGQSRRTLSLHS